jgi:hypothetical protein
VVVNSTWYVILANTIVSSTILSKLIPTGYVFLLYSSVVGSNKVAVSSEVLEVPTTKRRKVEEKSRGRKVVAMSTRITRSKVLARSTRTKKKPLRFGDD